jgi:hypothetical protein
MNEAHQLPISEWVQVLFNCLIVNKLVELNFTKSRCQSYGECQKCLPVGHGLLDQIEGHGLAMKPEKLSSGACGTLPPMQLVLLDWKR